MWTVSKAIASRAASRPWCGGAVAAFLSLLFAAVVPAGAQDAGGQYGFCYGLAGKPRVGNFSRVFTLGPSLPRSQVTTQFVKHLYERYAGYTTQEYECPAHATAAEAQAARRQLMEDVRKGGWPPVELDWLPDGATAVAGAAPAGAAAPANAPAQPPAPAAAAQGPDPAQSLCRTVTERPADHIGEQVTLLGVPHAVSQATVGGKTVMIQVYVCSDAHGSVTDYSHLFALVPRDAAADSTAPTRVAKRVSGSVQSTLDVSMPAGRMRTTRTMLFLTKVAIRAP